MTNSSYQIGKIFAAYEVALKNWDLDERIVQKQLYSIVNGCPPAKALQLLDKILKHRLKTRKGIDAAYSVIDPSELEQRLTIEQSWPMIVGYHHGRSSFIKKKIEEYERNHYTPEILAS